MNGTDLRYRLPSSVAMLLGALAILGGVALAAGLVQAPERTWVQVLVISNYLVGLGLGGLLLVSLFYVCGARWSNPLRRVPEAMTAGLPIAAIGILAVLFFRPDLYAWTRSDYPRGAESPLQQFWFNRSFFIVRTVAYFALWLAFAAAIVRNSHRQDSDYHPAPTWANIRLSAAFLVVFGVTCWLSSYDWIMSLEPEWSSTIFGVYNFAGLFISGIAAVIILVIWLRRGPLQAVITKDHLHDLGTLLFSFSSFWMYTWFCQYLLIWYVNNPEETSYFRHRSHGNWPAWLFVSLGLNWGIPFVVLLFRCAKRNPFILGTVAVAVLAGRWVDLDLMILPSQNDAVSALGAIDIGLLLGTGGLFALAVFRGLSKASLVPRNEPLGVDEAHSIA